MNSMDNILAHAVPRGEYRSDWAGVGVRLMAADGCQRCQDDLPNRARLDPPLHRDVSIAASPQVHNPPALT